MNDQTLCHAPNNSARQPCLLRRLYFILLAALSCIVVPPSPAAAAPHVLSAAEIDYPPFSLVDTEGNADGFAVELLRAALAAMNREVSFRTGTWSEVRGLLEKGEIQALPLVGRTPEREALFDFTVPYMSLHGVIVVRKGTRGINEMADLRGKRVAVMQDDNAEEFLRREERGIEIHTTATFEDALRELSERRHDAVVAQRLVALRLIQKTGLTNLQIIDRPIEGFRQDYCFAVKDGDRETLALLNEGLAIVTADGTYRHLHAKWFAALELPSDKPIVVGGDHNYPPFEYLNKHGKPAGYAVDLSQAIAQEMGLDIEIRLGPWKEIMAGLEKGEIDIVQGMFYTPARDLQFDFSQPHAVSHYVSIARKGEGKPPDSMEQLTGKRIVVQEGDAIHSLLATQGLKAQITLVETQEDVLRELAEGKHDYALAVRISSMNLIEKNGWTNLVLGKMPFASLEYCYAVSNNRKALLAQFSEGLKVLERNGEYRRIYEKWLGVYEDRPPPLLIALRYSTTVLVPLILFLLAAALWSWTLRRQVAMKTRELRESESRFRQLAETAPVGIVIADRDQNTLFISKRFVDLFGYTMEDMPSVKKWWRLAYPDEQLRGEIIRQWYADLENARQTDTELPPREYPTRCKNGEERLVEFRLASSENLNFIIFTDVTERRKLEEQFRQAQKMESVGRLAGGVAHDFNNMLGVILGHVELAMEAIDPSDPLQEDLRQIREAGLRSANLTRQLLAFARKQTVAPRVLDLNGEVESLLKMLRRLIGENINLVWIPGRDLWPVKLDPTQLDQILANLCVNARDAISDVGKITIETATKTFDKDYCAEHRGFVPGDYVLLAISDDGCGMDKATLDKIFEPFFTTKGLGRGTGLGLATIYGIVKQNNGFINVYSEPGLGSTFRIYLPRHAGDIEKTPSAERNEPEPGGRETVLLVEDEPALLELGKRIIERMGYKVLSTTSPAKAIRLAREYGDRIHLLITDVVMPEMNGRELAEKLITIQPDIKYLFMSGYTANAIAHHGVLDNNVHFIQKPFSQQDLASKIREVLNDPHQGSLQQVKGGGDPPL
ncbi:MAG: transporter substrate-binding domain-containing protein [Thermodesulfobacteriota bacterium]